MGQVASVFCLFFFLFFFFCYDLINFKIVFLSLYSDNLIILERKMEATERMREKKNPEERERIDIIVAGIIF